MPIRIESAAFAMEPVGFVVYGADSERCMAAVGAPQGVEQAFVMPEQEKVDAAYGYGGKSDSCIFACDYGEQTAYQGEKQDYQPECMDCLVAQVFRVPERQRRADACDCGCAADAEQQEVVVHDK